MNKKQEKLKLKCDETKALPDIYEESLDESQSQTGKLNNKTLAILEEFNQQEKKFQQIEYEHDQLMLDVDLEHTEKRLKEQEEDTARLMAQIDLVSSKDYMSKIEEMYSLAGMDPNIILQDDPTLVSDTNTILPLDEDADKNNECMTWNVNDVISPMEYDTIHVEREDIEDEEEVVEDEE